MLKSFNYRNLKHFVKSSFVATFIALSCYSTASAEWKPQKAIRIILPNAAGGTGDMELKAMQPDLEKEFGVPVTFDYMTAGGVAMYAYVYKSRPDGYTLGYYSSPSANIKEATGVFGGIDSMKDFDFIINVSSEYRCLVAQPDAPYNNLKEFLAWCKEGHKPSIAFSGIGSSSHFQILQIEDKCGIKLNTVPFRGNSPAKAAFLGKHVELWAIDVAGSLAQVKAGKCKVLAVCAPSRSKELPDVRTFREDGYDVIASANRGIVAPAGTPHEVKQKIADAFLAAKDGESMKKYCETVGMTPNMVTFDDYKALVKSLGEAAIKYKNEFVK